MKIEVFIAFIFSLVIIQSCNTSDEQSAFRFSGDYVSLYAPANEIFYSKLERVNLNDSTCGVKIYFSNTLTDFKNYFFSIDNATTENSDGTVFISFNKKSSITKNVHLKVWAAYGDKVTKKYFMNLSYEPQQLFESAGKSTYSKDIITIHETDLPLVEIGVTDFITYTLTSGEINFAKQEFRRNISEKNSTEERIKILAREISDKLSSHRGTPSDSMDHLSPMAQYKRAMDGKDKVWCGNLAEIFTFTCLCFNIPARRIGLGSTYDETGNPILMNAEGHTTTEYYDDAKKEWRFVDLTFNILSAFIAGRESHKLNMLEFYYALNNPSLEKKLMVEEYESKNHQTNILPIMKSKNYSGYKNFFKLNQKFAYAYKGGFYNLFNQ